MRILQRLFALTTVLSLAWSSAAGDTLTVSVYYPHGYIWVSPYQAIPVLTHYVIPVSDGSERTTTPRPFLTTSPSPAPAVPTSSPSPAPTGPVSSETPTTTTTRRGDN